MTYQAEYQLSVRNEHIRRTLTGWIILALASLVAAGLFSILLVVARTPAIQSVLPVVDAFRVALIIHVNLSVLVWLLAISGALWCLFGSNGYRWWDRAALWMSITGTVLIAISPFMGADTPHMSNYIPVLDHPVFLVGLAMFATGILLQFTRTIVTWRPNLRTLNPAGVLDFSVWLSAIIIAASFASVWASYVGLSAEMSGQVYFDFLFWGGGHVVQFAYTLLMMVAWVILASVSSCPMQLSPRMMLVYVIILALPIITVPFLYVAHEVATAGHRLAFTELMKYGGLSCVPIGLAVLIALLRAPSASLETAHLRSALHSSMILFAVGGVLGFLIAGLDIVIPAHYHGATVGVTVAFMGLCYYLLPKLGFGELPRRGAYWQPYIYASGQLLHIAGLAWTGGYGVQRKTAGAAEGVDRFGEIAGMALMGFGGLVSVIGGVMFLYLCYRSLTSRS